jgi:hypothetical protein
MLFLFSLVLIEAVQYDSDHYSFFQLCRQPNTLPFHSVTLTDEGPSLMLSVS